MATNGDFHPAAGSRLPATVAPLIGLAMAAIIAAGLSIGYPIPRLPEESVTQERAPDAERNARIESQWRALGRDQLRRTNSLGAVGLVVGAVMAAAGVAVGRRKQVLGDVLLTGGLLMLPWACAGLYRAYSHTGFGFVADEGMLPMTLAAVAGAAVTVGVGWWKYVHGAAGDANAPDDRLMHACYSILAAGSLVYLFNVVILHAGTLGTGASAPGYQTVVGAWFGVVFDPAFPLPEYRLAYGVVLVGLGALLRAGRARGLAGGVLAGGYLALVLCIAGAPRWVTDHPVSLWAVPVALVVLFVAVYQQARKPRVRSAGTS